MAGNIFKCELEAWKVWIRKKRIGYCITSGRLLWSCHPIVMPSNHKKGLFDVFWLDCPKSPLRLMLKSILCNYVMSWWRHFYLIWGWLNWFWFDIGWTPKIFCCGACGDVIPPKAFIGFEPPTGDGAIGWKFIFRAEHGSGLY